MPILQAYPGYAVAHAVPSQQVYCHPTSAYVVLPLCHVVILRHLTLPVVLLSIISPWRKQERLSKLPLSQGYDVVSPTFLFAVNVADSALLR